MRRRSRRPTTSRCACCWSPAPPPTSTSSSAICSCGGDKGPFRLAVYLQTPPGRDQPREGVEQNAKLLKKFPDAIERKKSEDADREYDLSSYDVIVAFDPDWLQLSEAETKLLKTWVENGGGLVVVAGPVNTVALSRKANADKLQAILDLYPVVVGDSRLDDLNRTTDTLFPLHFPDADKAPAFLNLDPEGKGPLAGWDEFFYGVHGDVKNPELKRGFYGANPVDSVKPSATVWVTLADPKEKTIDGKEVPFVAEQTVGKGRVVYLGAGEMWRLRTCRDVFHDRFWTNLIRYTAGPAAAKETPPEKKPSPDELSIESTPCGCCTPSTSRRSSGPTWKSGRRTRWSRPASGR